MAELQQARQLGALTQKEYLEALKYVAPSPAYKFDGGFPNEWDIPDPLADASAGWVPPVYGADEISPMEQAILNEEAQLQERNLAQAENMVAGGDGDDLGREEPVPQAPEEDSWWDAVTDWTFDTSVADERNASFNVKAAEANAESAEAHLAEVQERIESGQPVHASALEQAEAQVEHANEQHTDAVIEAAQFAGDGTIDYEGVVEAETALQQANVPGPDDDKATLEELAESEEFEEEDNPSKESDKGQQHPSEVVAEGEKAAKENPEMVEKAKGFFEDAFSDLFDGKELARMAIMYVGSRALGYSHGGSLNWAAKQYVSRLDAKHATRAQNAKEFAKSGKYTPASVAAYQKTGDLSALEAVGTPDTVTGNTNIRTIGGQKVAFQEIKRGDNTVYRAPDGTVYTAAQLENATQPYEPSFQKGTPEYRARRSRATGDAAGRFEEVWKAEDTVPGGRDKPNSHHTNIRPKQAADEFWAWSESMGMDPESDEALQIMTNAYRSAIHDGKTTDITPSSLKPYLQQEFIREKTGAPEEFITNPEKAAEGARPQYVSAGKMQSFVRSVDGVAEANGKSRDEVFQFLLGKWQTMDADTRKLYKGNKDESPFYIFAQKEIANVMK